jgi:hypothetical protein
MDILDFPDSQEIPVQMDLPDPTDTVDHKEIPVPRGFLVPMKG